MDSIIETYLTDDELLPEHLRWEGPGYYASQQRGAHEDQYIITGMVGVEGDDLEEIGRQCYRGGWGTPHFLDKPYGTKL